MFYILQNLNLEAELNFENLFTSIKKKKKENVR